ncbi:hypothetical protein C7974DRAFT_36141 [Boeremia exigua]|uniref:uncharacterized protein n=1 Tax=Boeremia exigua TaxID=749465 RepID=UPI001E8DBDF5|nr:uncharacterized protein C7974DRAFT_36141 [Boeremia exigua]KAH6618736.1 hypothetical protein C7974DRAFT_36141 [Boeremia exigua]
MSLLVGGDDILPLIITLLVAMCRCQGTSDALKPELVGSYSNTATDGLTIDAPSACRPMPRISVSGSDARGDTELVNLNPIDRYGVGENPHPVPTRESCNHGAGCQPCTCGTPHVWCDRPRTVIGQVQKAIIGLPV